MWNAINQRGQWFHEVKEHHVSYNWVVVYPSDTDVSHPSAWLEGEKITSDALTKPWYVSIEPQPEFVKNSENMWTIVDAEGETKAMQDWQMADHLFHNVYGQELGNSTVFDECKPVLVDGVWYWKEVVNATN